MWRYWVGGALLAFAVVACLAYVRMVKQFMAQDEDTWKS